MSNPYVNKMIVKPTLTGVFCSLGDRFLLGEKDIMSNITFGAVCGVSNSFAEILTPGFEKMFDLEEKGFSPAKSTSSYIFELSLASSGSFLVNKYILLNDQWQFSPLKRMGVTISSIILSDIITNYV